MGSSREQLNDMMLALFLNLWQYSIFDRLIVCLLKGWGDVYWWNSLHDKSFYTEEERKSLEREDELSKINKKVIWKQNHAIMQGCQTYNMML